MNKIAIIGNAGGGKSVLAKKLSKILDIPVYHIDKFLWKPDWKQLPKEEYGLKHNELIKLDKWIIDGMGYWEYIENRLKSADMIVFIDFPLWRHYCWALKRQIKCIFYQRDDVPENCPMWKVTFKMMKVIYYVHNEIRPNLVQMIKVLKNRRETFIVKSPKDLDTLIEKTRRYVFYKESL